MKRPSFKPIGDLGRQWKEYSEALEKELEDQISDNKEDRKQLAISVGMIEKKNKEIQRLKEAVGHVLECPITPDPVAKHPRVFMLSIAEPRYDKIKELLNPKSDER